MKRSTQLVLFMLALVTIFIWTEIAKSPYDSSVHLYFLDVGQGDSELIQKGDHQILIDGGPDDKILSEIGKVMPPSDRKIEIIILTHPHSDHLSGINQIIDRYEVGTIYSSGVIYTTNGYLEFLAKVKDKRIEYRIPEIGQDLKPYDNASLKFIWPGSKYREATVENINNVSEVVQYCYYSHCALMTGDIENDEQAKMLESCHSEAELKNPTTTGSFVDTQDDKVECDFQSELLKLSHHGSTNGTNQLLLDRAKPKYAVIEVGADNKFGHPHTIVLDLLKKADIETYRTDRDGTIELVLSQEGIIKK